MPIDTDEELAKAHYQLLTELRALRNGKAQEDDHIVAAILLAGSIVADGLADLDNTVINK